MNGFADFLPTLRASLLVFVGMGCLVAAQGAEPVAPAARHFDEVVAPVLSRHCLECHNASEAKGDLDLETGAGLADFVTPGEPGRSELWAVVKDDEMPKKRPPLSGDEKDVLRRWIEAGAEWGSGPVNPFLATTERRAGYDWWSLRPVGDPDPPAVRDAAWPHNEVDRFILARLDEEGWKPSPEADRRTLVRRLFFDLVGLPPTPDEVERFVADSDPQAYERLVDDLLARPQFGERWARRWLDVVRFGESQGMERNHVRDNAWRYRDWVIDAYNRDLPYDEFVRQQIAGDVLYPESLDALLATGFHVCGTWDVVGLTLGSAAMQRVIWEEQVEDLVATTGQAFLGLTVNCARCHDHKFDPISQREYYQFAALLGGVNQAPQERSGIKLKAEERHHGFNGTAHVIVPKQPPVFHVLQRGMVTKPKEAVAPAGLSALQGVQPDFGLAEDAPEAERRRKLAEWITDPDNPLATRVYVNRLWHAVFGAGLVDTPSDFGFNGGLPSHPDLLDWLARRFVEDGRSSKRLIRLLVTSATYRQASQVRNETAQGRDADARLRWRAGMRRLEGEEVRDAMLAVSGALNPQVGGPSYHDVAMVKGRNGNHEFTHPTNVFDENTCRRTIYRLWARTGNHPLLEAFDCPDPTVMAPRRNETITPLQALSLLHNPFGDFCAKRLAERLAGEGTEARVRELYRLVLLRDPTAEELALGTDFAEVDGLPQLALVLFNTNEFLYLP